MDFTQLPPADWSQGLDEHVTTLIFSFLRLSCGRGYGYSQLEVARLMGGSVDGANPVSEAVARRHRRLAAAKWTAGCRAVCSRWGRLASDDALWLELVRDAWPAASDAADVAAAEGDSTAAAAAAPPDVGGIAPLPAAGSFGAWRSWYVLEQVCGGMQLSPPAFTAAAGSFAGIKLFCQQDSSVPEAERTPAIADSLLAPLQASAWEAFEAKLREGEGGLPELEDFTHAEQDGYDGLLMLKMVLAVHNGQSTPCDEKVEDTGQLSRDPNDGRFAGYPKNDGFCIKNDRLCIKNDGLCI